MMDGHLKIAVIGDPHFCLRNDPKNSDFSFNCLDHFEESPWYSLKKHIVREGLTADILVCVGDMTTRSEQLPLKECWNGLKEMAKLLQADLLVSTAGNHDVHSVIDKELAESSNSFRALEKHRGLVEDLKQLQPSFPFVEFNNKGEEIAHQNLRTEYFGENLSVLDKDKCAIFSYNCCAEHGHVPFEQERGTFPESTQNYLKALLKKRISSQGKPHIFILHYPPFPLSPNKTGVYDFVYQGDVLLKLLEESNENWLIIHGHKHYQHLCYSHGGSFSPVVFSVSSLGIEKTNDEGRDKSSIQFYIIDIQFHEYKLYGTIYVWEWQAGKLWGKEPSTSLGFGSRIDPHDMAQQIAIFFKEQNLPSIKWDQIIDHFSELKFIVPADYDKLMQFLANKYSLGIDPPQNGELTQLNLK